MPPAATGSGHTGATSIRLAATDRLPHPTTFATFDPAQIPVAMGLGFAVLSS